MNFIADLHVHSKYSIATAKNLDLEHLYIAAQMKGINIVATGDFTHPAWFKEIENKLHPAENGLYELNKEFASLCDAQVPASCRRPVRFILETEISSIYKKDSKTRKNHNLVFMPNRRVAKKFNARLDRIGNIQADGRPILGLDAKNLLEIMLEVSDAAFLVPAHIWTPWFSVLGSKSGFDSLEECFEDLTPHIFAVETGLSSDPAMNWRVSGLDGLTLISNSDAHSPFKLGREANRFNTEFSYDGIKTALKTGDPEQFLGTFEYYPEEGKYHLDGHRKCDVRLWPHKTIAHDGICPVCGKPLTLGVLYRIQELADRPPGVKPQQHHSFASMIPLTDILSELLQKGPQTKTVRRAYNALLAELGSEFDILHNHDISTLEMAGVPFMGEAIRRMRHKEIQVNPGFDGEFGKIQIFEPGEREKLAGQKNLFNIPKTKIKRTPTHHPKPEKRNGKTKKKVPVQADSHLAELNSAQRRVVEHKQGPLLIVAGPGTGKTRTLTHRIAYLIKNQKVPAGSILAVTFTHKAAREMQVRLQKLLGPSQPVPLATTFHSFCLKMLSETSAHPPLASIDDIEQDALFKMAASTVVARGTPSDIPTRILKERILELKQQCLGPDDALGEVVMPEEDLAIITAVYRQYQHLLEIQKQWDYEDLIFKSVTVLESDEHVRTRYQNTYPYIFIDEYQDLNQGQYRLIRALAPSGRDVCAIGDPNQAIYGFRGSDVAYFNRFQTDFPEATVIHLTRNYRSTRTILEASNQVIQKDLHNPTQIKTYSQIDGLRTVHILQSPSDQAEAVAVGKTIERLVGGSGFHAIDFGKVDGNPVEEPLSFNDFAVLYRTRAQGDTLAPVLDKAGIPFQIANRRARYNDGVLGGLISLLKLVHESGSYRDFTNIIKKTNSGVGIKTCQALTSWGVENNYDLNQALSQARRFPIPGMRRVRQSKINAFSGYLKQLKAESAAMTGALKVRFLLEKTKWGRQPGNDAATLDGLRHLFETAERFDHRTNALLAHLALESDTDLYDSGAEKVALMTLHAAKGLEFPVVFIVGCEEDYLPYRRPEKALVDREEERRLLYVAMTRARDRLYLSWAETRRIYGKKTNRCLSSFVQDIETRLKTLAKTGRHRKQPAGQKQLELF